MEVGSKREQILVALQIRGGEREHERPHYNAGTSPFPSRLSPAWVA
jgi:hypothetical protein